MQKNKPLLNNKLIADEVFDTMHNNNIIVDSDPRRLRQRQHVIMIIKFIAKMKH